MTVVAKALRKAFVFVKVVALGDEHGGAADNVAVRAPVETVTDAAAGIVPVIAVVAVQV